MYTESTTEKQQKTERKDANQRKQLKSKSFKRKER